MLFTKKDWEGPIQLPEKYFIGKTSIEAQPLKKTWSLKWQQGRIVDVKEGLKGVSKVTKGLD
jgi:hypothetical protein